MFERGRKKGRKKTRIKRVSGHWQEEEKRGRRKKYELKRKN